MLLGLEGDQLFDVVILQRRQFDKTGEDRLAGNRVAGLGLAHLEALRQIRDGDPGLGDPRGIHRGIRDDGFGVVCLENQPPFFETSKTAMLMRWEPMLSATLV
jgi:hypothetical protein